LNNFLVGVKQQSLVCSCCVIQ